MNKLRCMGLFLMSPACWLFAHITLRTLPLIICALCLTQCTKMTMTGQSNQQLQSPYTMPATAYLALAKKQTGTERSALLIMAAGRLIDEGEWQEARSILAQINDLSLELANEKHVLLAKINLMQGQTRVALSQLASVQRAQDMPIYYQAQFHELLATAYQSLGQGSLAVVERIKLDRVLPNDLTRANNRRALWLSLTTLPPAELDSLALETSNDATLEGWLQLAVISRKSYHDTDAMLADISSWQKQYPHHPANAILPTPIESIKPRLIAAPKQIALLLPEQGGLAGPGNAIKDGFMAAYQASTRRQAVKILTYDTASGSVAKLYQQAVNDGADYIVGPLSKTDVATVAKMNHPVTTLLLNDPDIPVQANAYQFGLSPVNEARQVAAKARKRGLTQALVIAPGGVWGEGVVKAFQTQWRIGGGDVVDTLYYETHTDLNRALREFLHVSEPAKTNKHLADSNKDKSPARRQDFDVIFLVAYPTQARQIVPLLKYYYAGNVPVYATSTVYAGYVNTMKDRDLDGVIFCDMPWIFSHQISTRNWPEQLNSYNRLYALGMDSYALSNQLNQLMMFPALGVSDKSGVLYLSAPQQISRILVFGQFRHGVAQRLE